MVMVLYIIPVAMGVKDSLLGKLLGGTEKFSDEQVMQTINLLVENGVNKRATDIHIEPRERFVLIRYRIDGTLHGTHKLPSASLPVVVRQIKGLAHLNSSDITTPQDGQYATLVDGNQFEIQVSTLPVIGGEKVVLHINRRQTRPPELRDLGFWGPSLQLLGNALAASHGLLIVAAPKRSGKTTTMHSLLQALDTPSVSIATVENNIEYRLNGANQTQVRSHNGITFYDGLRAILNQDPNIVMVSSLPDQQTVDLAIRAAASGHLVLAGIFSNNAASALSHIRSMSDEPFLLTTELKVVVSQRLVRQLCVHCREKYVPDKEQLAEIDKAFGITSTKAHGQVHELEKAAASEDGNSHLNSTPSQITSLWRADEDGCNSCEHTGYSGSIAVVEVLENNISLHKLLLNDSRANDIHDQALKEGFIPMGLDGLVKALRGRTTIAEVLRATY